MLFKGKSPKTTTKTTPAPKPYKRIKYNVGNAVTPSGRVPPNTNLGKLIGSMVTNPLNLPKKKPSRPTTRKK